VGPRSSGRLCDGIVIDQSLARLSYAFDGPAARLPEAILVRTSEGDRHRIDLTMLREFNDFGCPSRARRSRR